MKLPDTPVDLRPLFTMVDGYLETSLLKSAIELDLFSALTIPARAEAVAQELNTDPHNTGLLLNALGACGLVIKQEEIFHNSPLAQTCLVKETETYLGDLFIQMWQMTSGVLPSLATLVRSGPPQVAGDNSVGTEDTWAQYAISLANFQRCGPARQAADIVSALPEFPSFRKMLDLGGGPGIMGLAIVGAHPDMTGIVFDRPAITPIAQGFIDHYQMQDRMTVISGDFVTDSIGEGYDLIWACAVLNFAGPDLNNPVKKIFKALNPGGVFVSMSDGLTHEDTQPASYVLNKLPFALMGMDIGIRQGAIAQAMEDTGFTVITSRTVETLMMPMELDIAKKS